MPSPTVYYLCHIVLSSTRVNEIETERTERPPRIKSTRAPKGRPCRHSSLPLCFQSNRKPLLGQTCLKLSPCMEKQQTFNGSPLGVWTPVLLCLKHSCFWAHPRRQKQNEWVSYFQSLWPLLPWTTWTHLWKSRSQTPSSAGANNYMLEQKSTALNVNEVTFSILFSGREIWHYPAGRVHWLNPLLLWFGKGFFPVL